MRKRWMRPTGNWRPALTEREVGFFLSPPFMVPLAPLPERPLPERPLAPLPDMFICVLGGGTCGEARVFVFGKCARQPGFGWSSAFKSAPSHIRRDGLITRNTPNWSTSAAEPMRGRRYGSSLPLRKKKSQRTDRRRTERRSTLSKSAPPSFGIFWISHFVARSRPRRSPSTSNRHGGEDDEAHHTGDLRRVRPG